MSGFSLCIEFKLCELHDKYGLTCTLLTDYLSFIESKILTFNQQSYKTLKARVMRQPPPGGGGGLPYERGGDVRRLAYECKFQILVSLRVFWAKHHYI